MSAVSCAGNALQASHLHERVVRAHAALRSSEWATYLTHLMRLPALLRENGLSQTLRYFEAQAADSSVCRRLLRDWLEDPANLASLGGLLQASRNAGGPAPWSLNHPLHRLALRIALVEAQRMRRSAEAVGAAGSAGAEARDGRREGQGDDEAAPVGNDLGAGLGMESDFRSMARAESGAQHLGLVWRHASLPPGSPQATTRAQAVTALLAMGEKWHATDHAALYRDAFTRWQSFTRRHACCATAVTLNRMFLALGSTHVLETQVLLHPVYGLPYLPGSSLKGALKAHLLARIKALPDADPNAPVLKQLVDTLFGLSRDEDDASAGQACMLDAWWMPNKSGPLAREVETPHHLDYYAGRSPSASAFDNPVPVAQLAVKGQFWLAISHRGIGKPWALQMLTWLGEALSDPVEGGIGGKTFGSGYGRLRIAALDDQSCGS